MTTLAAAEAAHRTAVLATVAIIHRLQAAGHTDNAALRIMRRHPASRRSYAAYLALCDARMAAPPEPQPHAQPEECPF
jgi:hypothetical protein